jgi:Ino eighty subunit 2
MDVDGNELPVGEPVEPEEVVETKYRWISTSRPVLVEMSKDDAQTTSAEAEVKSMQLSFSIPTSALALASDAAPAPPQLPPPIPNCDMEGCGEKRKYRLVRDWTRGACGMGHLKALEGMHAVSV